jgi:hypothetical protein
LSQPKLAHWLREERDPYLLGLLRVAIATLLLLQTLKFARSIWTGGYFGDVFHMPLLPEALVPSRAWFSALLAGQVLGCVLAIAGVAARPALLIAALLGLYALACDRLLYHNNRYVLLLVALLVPFMACDRSFTLPWRWRAVAASSAPAPRWAAYMIGALLSLVYLSSSIGKLLDTDWRGGTVMQLRFALVDEMGFIPPAVRGLLTGPTFARLASLAALATELLLALGLWSAKTRVLALWLGVVFHAGIELFSNVELFSYTMLSAYLVFATPELGERRLLWPAGSARLSAVFERLDWLRRFRHEPVVEQSEWCVVVDREGRAHRGLAALRELSRATPLLFPLWLPLGLFTWRSSRRADGVSANRE